MLSAPRPTRKTFTRAHRLDAIGPDGEPVAGSTYTRASYNQARRRARIRNRRARRARKVNR